MYWARYLGTPSTVRIELDGWLLAPAHRRLAELHAQTGDTAKAADHYAQFIELWQDADAELQPQVAAARRRLMQLAPDAPRTRGVPPR